MTASAGGLGRVLRLAAARGLNTFGRQILSVAVGWELYERTGSPLTLGLVGLVQVIPVVALFVPAGHLVDHRDRRALTSLAATVTGLAGGGLAVASALHAPVPSYYALLFVLGCATALHSPAASALVPMIIPRDQLARANAIVSSAFELAAIVGPGLAGLLLWLVAPAWVYGLVAATGLASGAIYRTLPAPGPVDAGAAPRTESARRDWRVGLRFIFASDLLLPALTLDLFAVLFAGATALLPVIARDVLAVGPAGLGVLRAAPSLGAIVMALVGARLPAWRRPGHVLLVVVALFGAVTVGFGLSRWFPLSVALLAVGGALDNISVVIRITLEQMVVPDRIRGRVSAVHSVFIGMSNELGELESGVAASLFGAVPAIAAGGAVAIAVAGVVALRWPALRAMPPLTQLQPAEDLAAATPGPSARA
ncbi:MAG: MFS transporter [Kofleriaceae bacterium]|nr:MFS transporter [Kofleriaceae bacterium]MCB9572670.1 MFS transporter [Kofleriaceae bacterium]